jgi:hypothetical protein
VVATVVEISVNIVEVDNETSDVSETCENSVVPTEEIDPTEGLE